MKTWTGYIHWLWEPWTAAEVRRTATAIGSQGNAPGQYFTLSTKKLPIIDIKVDYKTEVEPYLGEQLVRASQVFFPDDLHLGEF